MFENRKCIRKEMHARVQRNCVLVENTNGITPTSKVVNPCHMGMDCKQKDLHGYMSVLSKTTQPA